MAPAARELWPAKRRMSFQQSSLHAALQLVPIPPVENTVEINQLDGVS